MRVRQEILESLSPSQRMEESALFPQYHHLPYDRKQAVMAAFLHGRDLPAAQREQYLSSSEVKEGFSLQERTLLRGLTKLLPESRGGAGDNPEDEPRSSMG